MSAIADAPAAFVPDDRLARRNALVLAVAQALAGANNIVLVATGGLVGAMLAPDRGLATLPITVYVVGLWMGTLPVGMLARRFGRRATFQIGTVFGVLTGLTCCVAVLVASFPCSTWEHCSLASTRPRTRPIASPPPTPPARRSGRRRSPGS